MSRPNIDISRLTTDERLDLIEQLWDSLVKTQHQVPLSESQRVELDRRLDDMERDGGEGIPWEQVLRQIRENP
jgi:putative addiction module component (TIGR02574 family)